MKLPAPSPNDDLFCDLHGLTVAEVTARIQDELRRAFDTKTKKIVFIHGMGNHSDDGASSLARRAREFLKALSATPNSAIRRLEFGEQTKALNGNGGCVRVTLALELARNDAAFGPKPLRDTTGEPTRKILARRIGKMANPDEDAAVKKVEDELGKRYGKPGIVKSYKKADPRRGEWPGQR
ncbi:MAG: Smr/MutS family protein [Planctomycetes bacterium]|nr:Smr/MutS family protein [Planctomycetota bacterium]